ncbi:hypothetical protein F5883DRAFT_264280 [Diaporthe sp. PMI_573]|nr:hypothetical protein F5883DRAFT_264280 [Diaporthaceae sp. PMI_573]
MADAPSQPFTGRFSPRRASETYDDFLDRFKAHRDAERQQFLANYYRSKEARLPSPGSEEGLDDEEMAMMVAHLERDIRIENGRPEPGDLPNPVPLYPKVVYPPGKSLSECTDYEDSEDWRGRPEDLEYEHESWDNCLLAESSPRLKRARSPFEGDVHEPPAKRTRTDTTSAVLPAGQSISGDKRKRTQVGGEKVQAISGPKRRRTDAHRPPLLPSVTSSSTRKRKSVSDETHEPEVQTYRSLGTGRRAAGAKRRKMEEETRTSNATTGKDRNRILRVTRARRRELSGTDAQLVQLGERGRLEMQRQVNDTQGLATDAAASRSTRKQSSATTNKIEPKATTAKPKANNTIPKTGNTKIGAKRKTIASAKATAAIDAGTVTRSVGTKARKVSQDDELPPVVNKMAAVLGKLGSINRLDV